MDAIAIVDVAIHLHHQCHCLCPYNRHQSYHHLMNQTHHCDVAIIMFICKHANGIDHQPVHYFLRRIAARVAVDSMIIVVMAIAV